MYYNLSQFILTVKIISYYFVGVDYSLQSLINEQNYNEQNCV
jgi:hypothetical protein